MVGSSRLSVVSILALLTIATASRPAEVRAADPGESTVVLPPVLITAPVPLAEGLPRNWVPSAVDSVTGRDALAT